jgi:hypothetical protein
MVEPQEEQPGGSGGGGSAGGPAPDDAGPAVQVRLVSQAPEVDLGSNAGGSAGRRFRRDDEVLVEVWTNDVDVEPSSARAWLGDGGVSFTGGGPCDAGATCVRIMLRLAEAEVPATEADLVVWAELRDRSGNAGVNQLEDVPAG